MKKLILTSVYILFVALCFGQDWIWAKQIGGLSADKGGAKIDANNNIYCSGVFYGSCFFDNDTLYSSGVNDIFLAKYSGDGNELWAKRIGGSNPTNMDEWFGSSIIDNDNNCLYFSGTFYGTLTIDGHTVNSSGGIEMFFAKFDLAGKCQWLKKAGSYGDDSDRALCLDSDGNIYFMGKLAHNGTFDTISLAKGTFLSKLDTSGNILWARNEITGGTSTSLKLLNDNLIMTGTTAGYTVIIDTMALTSTSFSDGFIARLDLNGNCISAKRFKGHLPVYAGDFEFDSFNNIYLSGIFTDTLTIDGTTLVANNDNSDMFFCKMDSVFNLKWVKQSYSSGIYGAHASGVARDSEGKFYIAGYFSGNATFGSFNVSSSITKDMFIARYDETGECNGIRHFGEAEAGSIATGSVNIDSNGDLIVAGGFLNTVNLGTTTLTSHGYQDMFFAKTGAIVGIEELKAANNNTLLIYANPTTGKCTVTVPDDFLNAHDLMLSIFDNTGKIIQQRKLEMNEGKIKVDLEQEAKGIYNVTLGNGKKVYGGRVVFQ